MWWRRWLVLALGAGLVSCGSDGEGEEGNRAPVITELTVGVEAVAVLNGAEVQVAAEDPDGDPLSYSWSTTMGQLAAEEGEGPVGWTAPDQGGLATITVTVSDGRGGEASESLDLPVRAWASQADAVAPGLPFKSVSMVGPDAGWLVGGDEVIDNTPYLFQFDGQSWTDVTVGTSGHMHSVVALSPDDVWTAGGGGLGFHWDGLSWQQLTIPGGCAHGLGFVDAGDGWVTPAEAQPYMRRFVGPTLTDWEQYSVINSGLHAVSMVDASYGWAVGSGGLMIAFDGAAWSSQPSPVTTRLNNVHMLAADLGWAVGDAGVMLRFDGAAWTPLDTGLGSISLHGIYALDATHVWAVGSQGTILFYDGEVLSQVPSPTAADLQSVTFVDPASGWIVGHDSTILHLE